MILVLEIIAEKMETASGEMSCQARILRDGILLTGIVPGMVAEAVRVTWGRIFGFSFWIVFKSF